MVIDTGCSLTQENLQGNFNQGESVGRTVEHIVTLATYHELVIEKTNGKTTRMYYEYSPLVPSGDACGHGTMMAGIAAAPRGTDGAVCGVAYNCDLVTAKAAEDVVINGFYEKYGVMLALNAAVRRGVKIVSMSMGTPFYESQIADAIKKATKSGILIFCAAGTTHDSFTLTRKWGTVFPASMAEVISVTGLKENQDGVRDLCNVCHEGKENDFLVLMQKDKGNDKLLTPTLAIRGDVPAVDGGSSIATAMMAGMAAIVWSKYPAKRSSEILTILKNASTNSYDNRGKVLDVYKAVTSY
jgi:hypothetical protein